jgi:molybdopterin converting factor small subunit
MSPKMKLNLAFQELAGSDEIVEVKGNTVEQCLEDFINKYPRTKKWLYNEKGLLQSLVLLDNQQISQAELNRAVTDKNELWILNILEGG